MCIAIEQPKAEKPSKDVLLAALNQNWLHARHQEKQRLQLFNIYALILVAVIAFLSQKDVTQKNLMVQVLLLLVFLSLLSFYVYFSFLKWNAEFKNHIIAIQWASEELGLLKEMNRNKKEQLRQEVLKYGIDLRDYAYFDEAFMALPLPLSIRVHELFGMQLPKFLASFTLGIATVVFFYLFATEISVYIQYGFLLVIFIVIFILIFILSYRYCSAIQKKSTDAADVIHKFRKPTGINSWK